MKDTLLYQVSGNRSSSNLPGDEAMLQRDIDAQWPGCSLHFSRRLLTVIDNEVNRNATENLIYYYHPDHLGSSNTLTDITGLPFQHMEYMPFGETFVEENIGSYSTPYRFTSKELDDETGLYYYGARYYDPKLSMFFGVDPLADKFPGWSVYAYAMNNPIRLIDPNGMECVDPGENPFKQKVKEEVRIPLAPPSDPAPNRTTPESKKSNQPPVRSTTNLPSSTGGSPWYYQIPGVGPALESGHNLSSGNYYVATAAFGIALFDVFTLGNASGGTRLAISLGKVGEEAVGIVGSKIRIPSLTGTASYRIPDRLTKLTLEEVKNVQKLSLTKQLMDFNLYSQQTGRQFIIYTNATKISAPLRNLESKGLLIFNKIP